MKIYKIKRLCPHFGIKNGHVQKYYENKVNSDKIAGLSAHVYSFHGPYDKGIRNICVPDKNNMIFWWKFCGRCFDKLKQLPNKKLIPILFKYPELFK